MNVTKHVGKNSPFSIVNGNITWCSLARREHVGCLQIRREGTGDLEVIELLVQLEENYWILKK